MVIPGLTPGQRYDPTQAGAIPQGYSLNVPRDWQNGGMQTYDPRFATQLQGPSQHVMNTWNQRMGGVAGANNGYMNNYTKPGNPAGNGNPGTSSRGQMPQGQFNINTGITAGPAIPQATVQATQQRLQNYQAPSPGAQYAPFMQHLNSLVGGALGTAATDYGRDAAYANAQQLLAAQKAQAGAGSAWGSAMLGDYASRMGTQSQGLNAILALLQGMM